MTIDTISKSKYDMQKEYCKGRNLPMFVWQDGKCDSCHREIWPKITEEKASTSLITGCPYCSHSFCE